MLMVCRVLPRPYAQKVVFINIVGPQCTHGETTGGTHHFVCEDAVQAAMVQPHDPVQAFNLIITHLAKSDEAFRLFLGNPHNDLFLFRSLLFHEQLVFLLFRHAVTLARGRRRLPGCFQCSCFCLPNCLGLQPERTPRRRR